MSKNKLKYTILSISLLTVMAGAAMAPALGVIREHFADQSSLMVQFIVSLPALFIIITNLFFSSLCRLMKTKTIALVGLALYVVAGAGAYFIDNIWVLLVFRAFLGVSVGMIMPLSTGLLAFYFSPEEQAGLMGLAAAMNQMGGVVATFLAGFLATISWNCAFLVYLLGLIAMVLVALFLPSERLASKDAKLDARTLLKFHPSVVGMFLVMLLFFIYPTNFAISAKMGAGLGNGTITLIMVSLDLIAFFVGLFFGRLMHSCMRVLKYVAPVGFLIAYALMSCGSDTWILITGSIIAGIANGIGVPYLNTIASIKGGKTAATTVMPLLSAALYMGQFLSPIIVSPCARAIGGTPESPYIIGVIIAVIFLIQAFLTRKFHALPKA